MMLFGNKGAKKPQKDGGGDQPALTGFDGAPAAQSAQGVGGPADIFDVGTVDFEDKVMKASETVPVLVDFWAPWCGPCRQLMPMLEGAVRAAGGKVKLAKVNIDEHPELAQAMRVQSVPTVFAFFGGQPVTAFTGARPESEIKSLIAQLLKMAGAAAPDAIDVPETLTAAAAALADQRLEEAQDLYAQVLMQDENCGAAYAGLVRVFIAMGLPDQAAFVLQDVPDTLKRDPHIEAAHTALALAAQAGGGDDLARLAAAVQQSPQDLAARFDYGMALFAAGQKAAALDEMIAIIAQDRAWEDEKARKQILQFFDAMGPADPATVAGRRKLSAVLFS